MEIAKKAPQHGWIEVITGSMFSGKSEELIRRLRRTQIARQKVQIFKPRVDDRYSEAQIVSHSDMRIESQVVANSAELVKRVDEDTDVVGIDEAQFFDAGIITTVRTLFARGKRVIIAGLDTDYRDEPFGSTHFLMAIPEAEIVKLRAVCMRCRGEATRTFRKIRTDAQVVIGDADTYEALCYTCYVNACAVRDAAITVREPTAVVR